MATMKTTGSAQDADGKEWITKRDAAGREWYQDPETGEQKMAPDSATIERSKRVGAGRGLVNPNAQGFAKGGTVKARGWGIARKK